MTTSSAESLAISLNNQGVEFLNLGCYERAAECVSKALELVRGEFCDDRSRPVPWRTKGVAEAVPVPEYLFQDLTKSAKNEYRTSEGKEESSFVFDKPLHIVDPVSPPSSFCYEYLVSLSIMLLYNLALIHHLHGLESSESARLHKATALYELAYSVQINEDLSVSTLHTIAIVNNLGQIHEQLGEMARSHQYFRHVLTALMYAQNTGDKEVALHQVGFVTNVLPLIFPQTKPAPAA